MPWLCYISFQKENQHLGAYENRPDKVCFSRFFVVGRMKGLLTIGFP